MLYRRDPASEQRGIFVLCGMEIFAPVEDPL
jgi:hypothetical protein